MKKLLINVEGMACGGCEKRVQNALMEINGVKEAVADHKAGTVKVTFEDQVFEKDIKEQIEDIGFTVKED